MGDLETCNHITLILVFWVPDTLLCFWTFFVLFCFFEVLFI